MFMRVQYIIWLVCIINGLKNYTKSILTSCDLVMEHEITRENMSLILLIEKTGSNRFVRNSTK